MKKVQIVANQPDSRWVEQAVAALAGRHEVRVDSEAAAPSQAQAGEPDLILIDATSVSANLAELVAALRAAAGRAAIVVSTTSPTWQRARQVFLAGAADYVRKTYDPAAILALVDDLADSELSEDRYERRDDSTGG